MAQATVFLKTSLFTYSTGDTHVPAGAASIHGDLKRIGDGGVTITGATWKDDRGRPLEGASRTLFIPLSKVDHVDLQEG